MKITRTQCGHCGADLRDTHQGRFPDGTRRIGLVDMDKDCVVTHQCPDCKAQEPRPLAEVLAVADPSAFKEVP